jgi:hypothetical protein
MEIFDLSTYKAPVMWPTPGANDTNRSPEAWLKAQARHAAKGINLQKSLAVAVALSPSTSSAAASPASPSASLASDWPKPMRGGSGPSSQGSFAHYDPDSCSWRTSQVCLSGDLETWSETWPRAGMTRNGIAFQRQPLAPLTDETGSGLWPTPDTHQGGRTLHNVEYRGRSAYSPDGTKRTISLENAAKMMWPTPTASDSMETDGTARPSRAATGRKTEYLARMVHWPTPTSRDHKDGSYCPNVPVNSLLGRAVWPTPTVDDANNVTRASGQYQSLTRAIWATPTGTVVEPKSSVKKLFGRTPSDPQVGLADQVGGQLNADWVSILMGFPADWSVVDGSAESREC